MVLVILLLAVVATLKQAGISPLTRRYLNKSSQQ